jgi:hypothetical protein
MRLARFLNEKDVVKQGLSVMEPEIGEEYSDEEVKEYISIIKNAIGAQKKEEMNDAAKAMLKDLEDKLNKWENVDSETKPVGPSIPAVDLLAATAGAEGGEAPPGEAPPEGEEPEGEEPEGEEPEGEEPEGEEPPKKKKKKDKKKDEEK